MITASIESIESTNFPLFSNLLREKMKILTEYLKFTIKNHFDELKAINFSANDMGLPEYEKNITFSQEFITKFSLYLK